MGICLIFWSKYRWEPVGPTRLHKPLRVNSRYITSHSIEEQKVLANLIQEGDFVMLGSNPEIDIMANYHLNIWYDSIMDVEEDLHFVFKLEKPILISEIFGVLDPGHLNKLNGDFGRYIYALRRDIKLQITIEDDTTGMIKKMILPFVKGEVGAVYLELDRAGLHGLTIRSSIIPPPTKEPLVIVKTPIQQNVEVLILDRKTFLGMTRATENRLLILLSIVFALSATLLIRNS
tara:strand:- start:469 stop:1167 length:699 start_codon:yes stop_codon:yes gene_type:complete